MAQANAIPQCCYEGVALHTANQQCMPYDSWLQQNLQSPHLQLGGDVRVFVFRHVRFEGLLDVDEKRVRRDGAYFRVGATRGEGSV